MIVPPPPLRGPWSSPTTPESLLNVDAGRMQEDGLSGDSTTSSWDGMGVSKDMHSLELGAVQSPEDSAQSTTHLPQANVQPVERNVSATSAPNSEVWRSAPSRRDRPVDDLMQALALQESLRPQRHHHTADQPPQLPLQPLEQEDQRWDRSMQDFERRMFAIQETVVGSVESLQATISNFEGTIQQIVAKEIVNSSPGNAAANSLNGISQLYAEMKIAVKAARSSMLDGISRAMPDCSMFERNLASLLEIYTEQASRICNQIEDLEKRREDSSAATREMQNALAQEPHVVQRTRTATIEQHRYAALAQKIDEMALIVHQQNQRQRVEAQDQDDIRAALDSLRHQYQEAIADLQSMQQQYRDATDSIQSTQQQFQQMLAEFRNRQVPGALTSDQAEVLGQMGELLPYFFNVAVQNQGKEAQQSVVRGNLPGASRLGRNSGVALAESTSSPPAQSSPLQTGDQRGLPEGGQEGEGESRRPARPTNQLIQLQLWRKVEEQYANFRDKP